ncbi:MAG: hypothetical protein ACRD4D_09510 [Candidatus Acidiferrales bacterium]
MSFTRHDLYERFPFLESLEENWKPLSRGAVLAWVAFFVLFLIYLARTDDQPYVDILWVIVHEGGHIVFMPFGRFLHALGGTILQLAVPLGFAGYFALQRHLAAAALCLFFFFENFLGIATYLADAHAMALPLVSLGSGEVTHDWYYILSSLRLLHRDGQIAAVVRFAGWAGMAATLLWFAWRGWSLKPDKEPGPARVG